MFLGHGVKYFILQIEIMKHCCYTPYRFIWIGQISQNTLWAILQKDFIIEKQMIYPLEALMCDVLIPEEQVCGIVVGLLQPLL